MRRAWPILRWARRMVRKEPVNKYSGTPMSEWIAGVPYELELDAVGLWQIIPAGIDSFGLSGKELEDFTFRCIMVLLKWDAVPVKAVPAEAGFWAPETAYQGSHEEIARQIIRDWKAGEIVPDHDGLWFAQPWMVAGRKHCM